MKYLGLFVIAFIVLVPINALLLVDNLSQGWGLFISVFIALGIVLLGDYIILLIKRKKDKAKVENLTKQMYQNALEYYQQAFDSGYSAAEERILAVKRKMTYL